MAEILVAELQLIIVLAALIAGAARGAIGYWITAPETEPFNSNKVAKTMLRYAIFNLVIINAVALTGVSWTVIGVAIFTAIQIAPEVGFDLKKT